MMPEDRPRYFVEKSNGRYYWQPSTDLRRYGFKLHRLSDDPTTALEQAAILTDKVDQWRVGLAEVIDPRPMQFGRQRRKSLVGSVDGVYVIGSPGGLLKIGVAMNVHKRLQDIQTGSGHQLQIFFFAWAAHLNAYRIERLAHDQLARYRRNGEWFNVAPDHAIRAVSVSFVRVAQENEHTPMSKLSEKCQISLKKSALRSSAESAGNPLI